MQGVYREIIEPERLVFTFAWEDEDSQPKHETLVTVTFTQQNNKTLMTFHQAIFESAESQNSHQKLVNAPITYVDGRHDRWRSPPTEIRHL